MSTPTPVTYANLVMLQAIKDVDAALGTGYSKAHPELVAAYMHIEITLRGQNAGTP